MTTIRKDRRDSVIELGGKQIVNQGSDRALKMVARTGLEPVILA